MSDNYEDLARRLLSAAPDASPPNRGRITVDWQVDLVNGKPDLYLTVGCDPAHDQADIVALLRYEADQLDFDPAERAEAVRRQRRLEFDQANRDEQDESVQRDLRFRYLQSRQTRPWRVAGWKPTVLASSVKSVKFMPDYGAELPLWNVDRVNPPFDHALLDDLADLQIAFDVQFDAYAGWQSEPARRTWADRAAQLVELVRQALPADVELEVDLWPLDTDGHRD